MQRIVGDQGITGDRKWTESPASIMKTKNGKWMVSSSLPEGATAWFVNARSGNLTVSSDYYEAKETAASE